MKSIIYLAAFLMAVALHGQDSAQLKKEIDKMIFYNTDLSFEKIPGYLIGVIDGDSTFIFEYGKADLETGAALQEEVLFEVGGMTKVFTSLLTMYFVESGQMHLDSTLNQYLPEHWRGEGCNAITINQVLTHSTGIPRMPVDFGLVSNDPSDPYIKYSKEDLRQFYLTHTCLTPRKPTYQYSHTAFAILEVALERVGGAPFDALLQKHIFEPLGMPHSTCYLPEGQDSLMAQGYSVAGRPVEPWTFTSFAASEGLKTNMADLLQFAQAHLEHKSDLPLDKLLTPQIDTKVKKRTYIAHGWHVIKQKKFYHLILHPGSTSGHRVHFSFVPETKTAVVILANSANSLEGLGYMILRMVNRHWKRKK